MKKSHLDCGLANAAHRTVIIRQLRAASADLQEQLRSYSGSYYVRDSLRGGADEIHLQLRPGGEKLGLSLAEVSRQLRQACYDEGVQRLLQGLRLRQRRAKTAYF